MTTQDNSWEKEFDEKYKCDDDDGYMVPDSDGHFLSEEAGQSIKSFIKETLLSERQKMEANLENSAWAKAFESMIRDGERQKIKEMVEGKKRGKRYLEEGGGLVEATHDQGYDQALEDILKEI